MASRTALAGRDAALAASRDRLERLRGLLARLAGLREGGEAALAAQAAELAAEGCRRVAGPHGARART